MTATRAETPVRVHITNCVLLNGGDAAIVEATIETLRERLGRPVEFTVYDQQPDVSAQRFPELAIRPWPWQAFGGRRLARTVGVARALLASRLLGRGLRVPARLLLRRRELEFLEEYAQADLVISKGGTYLVEQYRLGPHLLDFGVCRALRRPLVLGPQSLGPFRKPVNRSALRRSLDGVTVFARDERSLRHLEDIGLAGEVAADTAFVWAKPESMGMSRCRRRCVSRSQFASGLARGRATASRSRRSQRTLFADTTRRSRFSRRARAFPST